MKPGFAGSLGERLHTPVVQPSASIEHSLLHPDLLRPFGEELPDPVRPGGLVPLGELCVRGRRDGAGRAVVEAAGIKDILSKSLGSSNPINIVHATIAGLRSLRRPEDIARGRGRDVHEIAPRPMLEGMAEAELAMAQKRAEAGLEDTDA